MTALIKNSVIHFAKILKVYTVLALLGAGVVMLAQLGAYSIYSIENIALTVGIIFTCTLLVLWILGDGLISFIIHTYVPIKKAKHRSEKNVSPDISPRLKKS